MRHHDYEDSDILELSTFKPGEGFTAWISRNKALGTEHIVFAYRNSPFASGVPFASLDAALLCRRCWGLRDLLELSERLDETIGTQ